MITREEESLEANGRHFRYTSYELLLLIDLFYMELYNKFLHNYYTLDDLFTSKSFSYLEDIYEP